MFGQVEKASDEILTVSVFQKDGGEHLYKCPHCGNLRGIDSEDMELSDLAGEQYQDNLCDGWMQVSDNPKRGNVTAEFE